MNPDANDDPFDDFATAAGAALRRPAPDNGLAGVRSSLRRRRISQIAGAGGAAMIVFAVGGLLLANNQDDSPGRLVPADDTVSTSPDSSPSTSAPETTAATEPAAAPYWVPPGKEFASTDFGPLASAYAGPVVAGLSRQISIEGHRPLQVVTASLRYDGRATATEQVCVSENGGGGCRDSSGPVPWSVFMTSSVDNGDADFDLWGVEGLPENTAFVSYSDGDLQLWQRPIMGFAAFPNVEGNEEIVIAYDADGTELGQFGVAYLTATAVDEPAPLLADISQAEFQELSDLTTNTVRECLTSRGGTFTGDVATFPSDVDQAAVWEQCVAETKQIVGDAVQELNPRFYDPSTERPQN
ncbi:MAG TPA: hypothetical protein VLN74_02955 [Ilumatobacteraceae bacterium]|nr:hypothetical protein [Ilumatobacteraceae bacterium]